MDVYVNGFFPRTARFWNSQPIKCFPLTYDLNCFRSRINRHLFINCKFFLKRFHVCCNLFCVSFSCNSMLCRGCSALHGVTPNEKKLQHEKKPESNLKRMQSVVLEQATAKFILIFIVGTISVTINDSCGVLCFNLYLINIFGNPTKAQRCTYVIFKLTPYCLSVTDADLNL